MSYLTEHDIRDFLTGMIEAGSQKAVADRFGISTGYLGDVIHGRRGVSGEFAKKLGFERVVVFRKVG